MEKYIAALDEGTTSARAALFNVKSGKIERIAARPVRLIYPKSGWVEQDADELYKAQSESLAEVTAELPPGAVIGLGITNQRETIVMWDRSTGKPVWSAIVWQCRRTKEYCAALGERYGSLIEDKTGLVVDPYFSATKIRWVLDNVPKAAQLLKRGMLCVGTVDSFLIFRLTGGKSFVTDATNASRTMLFNIREMRWDRELLDIFGIPESALPRVIGCDEEAGTAVVGGGRVKICGVAGDQQAAMVGQACFNEGDSKITYGTGLFMLYNTGRKVVKSTCNMLSTVAYTLNKDTYYALEGSVFNAGSAVQWLRDELCFFDDSAASEDFASKVKDTCGVYVVPAFTGLGAPYWNSDCRGIITGLTRNADKYHITRAVLESMAYSAKDLADMMEKDSGIRLKSIRCDGGASANGFLMQFQSDVLGVEIERPKERESTALGCAYLCGMGLGLFGAEEIVKMRETDRVFKPEMERSRAEELYYGWIKAVNRCLF